MVAGGCAGMDDDGKPIAGRKLRVGKDRELKASDFLMKNPAPLSSSVVIKSCVFRDCGVFDTALRSSEDRDMWIRAAMCYRVYVINKPLVFIRKHRQSMSAHAVRMRENTLKTIRKAYDNRVVSRLNVPFWLRVLGIYYFETAWTHYDEGRRGDALGFIIRSLLIWPGMLPAAKLNEPPFFRFRALVHFLLHRSPGHLLKKLNLHW